MASEQPKKATGGGFGQFLAENRAALIKECPGQPAVAAVKLASERWKALDEVAKAKYQKMYEAAKQKYDTDLASFLSGGGEMKARKVKKDKKATKTKDENRPKQPAGGAFGCFLAKKRQDFMKELGPGKAVTAVTKLASERWKETSEADKRPFQEEYEAKAAAYKKAMETYVPPAAEEASDEEDEEEEVKSPSPKAGKRKASEDTQKKEPKARKSNTSKGTSKQNEVEIDEVVLAEARKAQLEAALKNLANRPEIVSLGLKADKLLSSLKEHNGLVNPTKHALLGC